jgi:Uma2 family endonuclease
MPGLADGQRLTRAEFERRYEALPELKKAELIGGVVHLPSRSPLSEGRARASIVTCLGIYELETPGVEALARVTVRLGDDDVPEPDACLRLLRDGASRVDEDDFIAGPPELVVEASSASLAFDLDAKRRAYERHGCREYVVLAVPDRALRAFTLEDGQLVSRAVDADGIYRSRAFPGLWLDETAIVDDDPVRAMAVTRAGLATPEHAAFVRALATR